MAHTIIAWSQSLDEAATDTPLDAVEDPTVREAGDYIYVPELNNLIGAGAALGTTAVQAYLESPSLRALQFYYIEPIADALVLVGSNELLLHPLSPVVLRPTEGLRAYSNADPAAAEQHTIIAMLSDGPLSPITGEMIHIYATASITEAAGEWAEGELTFDQELATGRYQVVGARVRCGGNGIAFRFIPIGEVWRPGGVCVNAIDEKDPPLHRNGGLGAWFEFDNTTPPSLEVLASAAGGTSQVLVIDAIKTA